MRDWASLVFCVPAKCYVSRAGPADRHRAQTEQGPVEAEGSALFAALSNWTENSGPVMAPAEEASTGVGTRRASAGIEGEPGSHPPLTSQPATSTDLITPSHRGAVYTAPTQKKTSKKLSDCKSLLLCLFFICTQSTIDPRAQCVSVHYCSR